MLKVGKDSNVNEKTGRKREFGYKDVEYDCDDWADATKYLPADFDLVFMKTESKVYTVWICGKTWDGLRIPPDAKVLFWKLYD